jgi:hypothetical protein
MMNRFVRFALLAALVVGTASPSLGAGASASQKPAGGAAKIKACSVVTKEEVKKHLPWRPQLDTMPIEEEAVGATGSSCNYPSVFVQILPFSQATMDAFRKSKGIEPLSGIGDEAMFRNNADNYAEVAVKVGAHIVTLQANVDGNMSTIKPATLNLAKLYVTKLR